MGDFIAWVSDPSAYNWITLIGSVAALLTALFTGYTAATNWLDRREKLTVEWEVDQDQSYFRVICHVSNQTSKTLTADTVRVRGPVRRVERWSDGRPDTKHESWEADTAPLRGVFEPKKSGILAFIVYPDPSALRDEASSWRSSTRLWLAKALWRTLGWRLSSGPKFSIRLTMTRRVSPMRPIRRTHELRIHAATAMKMAETIEASAAKR